MKCVSTLRLINIKEKLRLATNSSGREAWCTTLLRCTLLDARTMAQAMYGCNTVSLATVLEAHCLWTDPRCASMERRVDRRDGQWRRSMRPLTCWSAQRTVPCRSRYRCSAASCHAGRILGSLQAIVLSEPGATFISNCAPGFGAWSKVVLSGAKTAC